MSPRSAKAQHAFTLVEVMVALFVLATGMLATARVFIASGKANVATQQREVALHVAQRELEQMRNVPWNQLAMSDNAEDTGDSNHKIGFPGNGALLQLGPSTFQTAMCYSTFCGYERQWKDTTSGAINPGGPSAVTETPSQNGGPFTETAGSVTYAGTIYRYVTRRGECAPSAACSNASDNRRIVVAVIINGMTRPVWISSVISDPSVNAAPSGSPQPHNFRRDDGPTSCASGFTALGSSCTPTRTYYLYDSQCMSGAAVQGETFGDHVAHSTASYSVQGAAPATSWSVCSNVSTSGLSACTLNSSGDVDNRYPNPSLNWTKCNWSASGGMTNPAGPVTNPTKAGATLVAPDLMGTTFPSPDPPSYLPSAGASSASPHPGASNPADLWSPYTYSTDSGVGYNGTGAGGLRLATGAGPTNPSDATSCDPDMQNYVPFNGLFPGAPTSATYDKMTVYQVGNVTNTAAANKWNVHRWSTNPIGSGDMLRTSSQGFDTASITLWTKQTDAMICVKLIDRTEYPNGLNNDGLAPFSSERVLACTPVNRKSASNALWTPFTLSFSVRNQSPGSGCSAGNTDSNGDGVPDPLTLNTPPGVGGATERLVLAIDALPFPSSADDNLRIGYGTPAYPASLTLARCDGGTGQTVPKCSVKGK